MNPLKLQILLGAVDKLTAPLKAVSGQSRITAKDLVDTKKKIRDLETQAGQIEGYKTLGAQIGATKAQLKQAEGSFSELQRKIAETPKPTRVMINEFNKAEKALSQLKTKQGEMITRHAQMGEAMRKTGINTGNLSETQRRLKTDLAAANTVLDSQRTKLGQLADQQKRLNQVKASYRQTQELRGQIAGHGAAALATGTAMGLTTLKPVIEFARAETSVVDLKVSMMGRGGQVRQEFQAISDLATKLGNKLPGTTADFQNMMSTLIQQGMSAKSILGGLGEATAYLGVQLKMPFDQAALFAAKLQDATATAEQDMMGLMDTIQRSFYLGVDSNNMLGAFTKLTPAMGILRKSGLEAAKVLAPLVIMADQAGMAGESSGNAYRKVFQMSMNTGKIAKATKGTGLKLNFTDGKGEFAGMENMFAQLAKLKGLNTERRLQVLKGIYGDDAETLQVLELIISKGMDGYRATQKKMADQAALQERVNAQLGTLGSLWDAATGTFTNAMVNFGEAIAPEIKAITEWIGDLSERLGNWANRNPELSNTLMKIGGILSAVTIAFGGLSLAVAAVLGPMAIMKLSLGVLGVQFGGATQGLSMFSRMMALNSRMAAPLLAKWAALGNAIKGLSFAKAVAGMRGMLTAITSMPTKIGAMTAATWRYVTAQLAASKAATATKFTSMMNGLKGATTATYAYIAANGVMGTTMNMIKGSVGGVISLLKGGLVGSLKLVGHTIAFVGRLLLMNPIGLLVTAIGIAALTIYRYWEPIKAFFSGFFQGLKEGLGPVAAVFAPAFEAMANALSPLKPIWDGISSALGSAWEWMTNLLTPIKTTQQELDGATNAGKRFGLWLGGLGKSFIQVIADFTKLGSDLIDGLLKGISDKWAELKTKISAMTDLLPDWWKGDSEVKASVSQSGYLTGSLPQPALAGASGYAPRMAEPARIAPTNKQTIDNSINSPIHVYQQPGQSPQDVAKTVRDEMQRMRREEQASQRASLRDNH